MNKKKIKKLVAIQPVSFLEESKAVLDQYCEETIFYDTQDVYKRQELMAAFFVRTS